MELRVLGPVELSAHGRTVEIGAAKQRALLALLVLQPGQPVTSEWLIDHLWDGEPPPTARTTLQSCVYRLRKLLTKLTAPIQLHTRTGGYLLEIPSGILDIDRFEQATAEGLRQLAAGNPAAAAEAFRSGLDLWRGEAFAGIDLLPVRHHASRLEERRLDVIEHCLGAELAAGGHAAVAGDLDALCDQYPLRESFWQLRMLALARSGRKADALEAYQQLYRLLDEELGIEPSTPVRQLRQQILTGDPALTLTQARAQAHAERSAPATSKGKATAKPGSDAIPRLLPAAIGDFTGRKADLARLDELLPPETSPGSIGEAPPQAVVISAISGTAGIGKTMLAVHWAHRVAGRFPEGQLYVNLRGFHPTSQPMSSAEAVRGFLDALGVPAERIPADLDTQGGLYRSLLAERRMLLLLDNARDSQQVRPLLPGAPGCLVIVTSRNQLTSLVGVEAARPILLDLLSTDEARELLARRLGQERIDAEPQATEAIIAACARLPLALVIVAARAATHPDFPLHALADELVVQESRLDALTDSDTAADVRAVFSWSYNQLTPPAARLFRLLGLHPGPDISAAAAASLAGVSPAEARPFLAELTRAHLLTQHKPGRYTFHDLLRAYATELARTEPDPSEVRRRMLDHYLHTAHAADCLLNPRREPINLLPKQTTTFVPTFTHTEQAVAWLTAEHPVLLAAIELAGRSGLETHAWQLAWAMVDYLDRYGHWQDWLVAQHIALDAAGRTADRPAQARAHDSLIRPYVRLGRLADARHHAEQALQACGSFGDLAGEARAQHKLGWVLGTMDQPGKALSHMRQAHTLYQQVGHRSGEVDALAGLGWLHTELGDYDQAIVYCRQSVELCQQVGHHSYGWASSWEHLGRVLHLVGNFREAIDCNQRSLKLYVDLGDRHNQAQTYLRLAEAHEAAGEHATAIDQWRTALAILDDLGHSAAGETRTKLAGSGS